MICLKPFKDLGAKYVNPPLTQLDLLWHVGWRCTNEDNPRSSWAGFMHDVCKPTVEFPPPSDILMLPIIDLHSSDMSCIYSTLRFIEQ